MVSGNLDKGGNHELSDGRVLTGEEIGKLQEQGKVAIRKNADFRSES